MLRSAALRRSRLLLVKRTVTSRAQRFASSATFSSAVREGSPRLTRAQGGVTLGPEQGELGANFCHLGHIESDGASKGFGTNAGTASNGFGNWTIFRDN